MIIAYTRSSTSYQESGLDAQERAIKAYAESHSIADIEFISDEGISGAKTRRKGLDKLLELCKEGRVEKIICYSFSRISRSTKHLIELVEFFNENNITFISLTEGVQSDSPTGKFFISLMGALAELERNLVRERTVNGLKAAKERGKILGAPKQRNSELIKELRAKGFSMKEIARVCGCSISTVSRELSGFFENEDQLQNKSTKPLCKSG